MLRYYLRLAQLGNVDKRSKHPENNSLIAENSNVQGEKKKKKLTYWWQSSDAIMSQRIKKA